MSRGAALMSLLLILSACGQDRPSEGAPPAAAPEETAGADVPGSGASRPVSPEGQADGQTNALTAEVDADAGLGDIGAPPDLDDLPPIRTGPMAQTAFSPYVDELTAEREAQLSLPTVRHPVWDTLRTTRISIDEQTQLFNAAHPSRVRALEGRSITVRGYMLPLEATNRTGHFLISPYTPVCFFHPPAEPNEVIEVRLSRPIEAGYHLVEVTGALRLANDGEKGLFFVIPEGSARIVERIFA